MSNFLSSLLKHFGRSHRTMDETGITADLKWIFCGGMLRSGSTLQYNIASEIVEQCAIGRREVWTEDHQEYFSKASQQSITVFKSHILSEQIAGHLNSGQGVALISFRDVRDATASWQAKTRKKMDLATGLEFVKAAVDLFDAWEKLPRASVFVSKYEDVIVDLEAEVERIAKWLGLDLSQNEIQKISSAVSVPAMASSLKDSPDVTVSETNTWNTRTLVHTDHLNGGDVGRYRHELLPELIEALTQQHHDWLIRHGYDAF